MAARGAQTESESGRRRFWGIILLIVAVFVGLSIFSYDWRDVALLRSPANDPPCNLIGPLGARVGFAAFFVLGVGGYLVPFWVGGLGLILLTERGPRVWPRLLWLTVAAVSLALATELRPDGWRARCLALNIADPGGLAGYLLTRAFLVRWLSPVGAGILVWSLFGVALVMAVEGHRIRQLAALLHTRSAAHIRRLRDAIAARRERRAEAAAERVQAEPEQAAPVTRPPRRTPPPKKTVEKPPASPAKPPVEKPPAVTQPPASQDLGDYQLPPLSLLDPIPAAAQPEVEADTDATSHILEKTLAEFGIEGRITNVETGPVVTRYELLPAPGIRVERIAGLQNNLALSLKAHSIRVQAPIPGKGVVGIEVPNAVSEIVYLRELLEGDRWRRGTIRLPLALGKDVGGTDVVADLSRMPHLLIAGATGSGKTVCMNSILTGLLMSRTPDDLRLLLVDPKIVEFASYSHLPHLVIPVVTDPKKVALALRWAIEEMERRYKLFAKANVRNIESFNSRVVATQVDMFDTEASPDKEPEAPAKVPYIVVVIDELADLMLAAGPEIENSIARLAQLSRAVGIHMIIATQRPSVNVITGTIKANFPARIAFQVAQKVDSRTILDTSGAETLLGRGDMLYLPPATGRLVRGQGALVNDHEINKVVEFIKQQAQPAYETQVQEQMEKPTVQLQDDEDDELLPQAVEIIRETRRASTSSLQRRLRIGYNRAGRLMDILEQKGIVGPPRGSDPREILIDLDGDIPNNGEVPELEGSDEEIFAGEDEES